MQGSLIVYFKLALIRYDGCPGPTSLAWPVQKETEVDAMQRAVPSDDLIGLLRLFVANTVDWRTMHHRLDRHSDLCAQQADLHAGARVLWVAQRLTVPSRYKFCVATVRDATRIAWSLRLATATDNTCAPVVGNISKCQCRGPSSKRVGKFMRIDDSVKAKESSGVPRPAPFALR